MAGIAGPFTAHPKIDPVSGEMMFFGYNAAGPFTPALSFGSVNAAGVVTRFDRFGGGATVYPVFQLLMGPTPACSSGIMSRGSRVFFRVSTSEINDGCKWNDYARRTRR